MITQPAYGAVATRVYEARDEDYWEEQAILQQQQQEQARQQLEYDHVQDGEGGDETYYYEYDPAGDEEYYEETDYTPVVKQPLVSDVSDQVYFDTASLTNSWLAALHDYKFQHPSQFAPSREAPRTLAQKQAIAPLWYGPATASAHSASTTKEPATVEETNGSGAQTQGSGGAGTGPASIQTTGSSKSAKRRRIRERKEAEAAAAAAAAEEAEKRASKRQKLDSSDGMGGRQEMEGVTAVRRRPMSPRWQPASPRLSADRGDQAIGERREDEEEEPPALVAGPSSTEGVAQRRSPSSASRLRALASQIPQPPPIVPLDEEEAALAHAAANGTEAGPSADDTETDEELLGAALWAWYNAGYQQGLLEGRLGFGQGRS